MLVCGWTTHLKNMLEKNWIMKPLGGVGENSKNIWNSHHLNEITAVLKKETWDSQKKIQAAEWSLNPPHPNVTPPEKWGFYFGP